MGKGVPKQELGNEEKLGVGGGAAADRTDRAGGGAVHRKAGWPGRSRAGTGVAQQERGSGEKERGVGNGEKSLWGLRHPGNQETYRGAGRGGRQEVIWKVDRRAGKNAGANMGEDGFI